MNLDLDNSLTLPDFDTAPLHLALQHHDALAAWGAAR